MEPDAKLPGLSSSPPISRSDGSSRPEQALPSGGAFRFVLGLPRAEVLSLTALVVLFVVGAFLRRYHLGYQSLWFDEADVVQRAGQDLASLLPSLMRSGENGPLYTLFLHMWVSIFGSSELSVRFPSFVFGTLGIPAIYFVGRRLGGCLLGLAAAFLLTVSPYHIWYSQEAKMYTLAMLLTLLSVGLFLFALESRGRGPWAAYVVITTLALYVHLATILVVAAQVLMGVLVWRRSGRLGRGMWVSFGVLVLPYMPLAFWELQVVLTGSGVSSWYPSLGLHEMLQVLFVKFSINRVSAPWELIATVLVGIMVGAGLVPAIENGSRTRFPLFRQVWLLVYLLTPVLILYAISTRVPLFHDRYLIIVLPAYLLLAASGLAKMRGKLLPAMTVVVLLLAFMSYHALSEVNYSTASQKEDWRGIVQYVQERTRLKDVIFLLPGYTKTAVEYYYGRSTRPPNGALAAAPSVRDEGFDYRDMDKTLSDIARGRERAWLIVSPERAPLDDPEGKIREWFDGNFRLFDVQTFNGAKVYRYSFNGPFQAWSPPPSQPVEVRFGEDIRLFGVDIDMPLRGSEVEQGRFLFVTLYWQALSPLSVDYNVSVQLVGSRGQVVSQRDIGPLDGYYPTSKWKEGEAVRDYHDLYVRPDVPPGEYDLLLAVYPAGRPEDRLAAHGGQTHDNAVLLSRITVLPPAGPPYGSSD